MSFARDTTVPAERSRQQIEETMRRYGADSFFSGWKEGAAYLGFRAQGRYIKFVLALPPRDDKRFTHQKIGSRWKARTPDRAAAAWEQEGRRMWRALLLVIKAKLEAVASGISTFENEFLANIMLPDQRVLGEVVAPWVKGLYETGKVSALPEFGEDR
jgi:hypothetical protein